MAGATRCPPRSFETNSECHRITQIAFLNSGELTYPWSRPEAGLTDDLLLSLSSRSAKSASAIACRGYWKALVIRQTYPLFDENVAFGEGMLWHSAPHL
jgi:hypothetical protein